MRTALLINSNGAIGRAACRTLVDNRWRVIATCLSETSSTPELDVKLLSGEDIASPSFASRISARLIGELRPPIVDLLVFNCELAYEQPWGLPQMKLFADERMANVRRVGNVVRSLAPHVRQGGHVIVIAGAVVTVNPRHFGVASSCRVSSLAAKTVDEDVRPELAERHVTVECVLPKLILDRRYGGWVEISGAAVGLPMCRADVAAAGMRKATAEECAGFDGEHGKVVRW